MIKLRPIQFTDVILERDSRWTWKLLALQAGSLNMFGYLSAHHFVSHITSFASNFALSFHKNDFFEAFVFLVIPLFFLSGSFFTGVFTEVRRKRKLSPHYIVPLGFSAVLLSFIYLMSFFKFWSTFGRTTTDSKDLFILLILCFCMGMQNALFTTVSGGIIRTTHLTGLTTDLGIELAENLFLRKKILSSRNRFRLGSILFFLIGAFGGTYLYTNWQFHGLLFNIATSLLLGIYFYQHRVAQSQFNSEA